MGRRIVEGVTGDARDEITFVHDGVIYIVTQHSPYLTPETIYAPTLRHLASGLEGQRALRARSP